MAEHLLLLPILAGNISGDSDLVRKLKKLLLLCREAVLRNQRQGAAPAQLCCSSLGPAELGRAPFVAQAGQLSHPGTFLPKLTTGGA